MLNRNICVRTLGRALVISSFALSAACEKHAAALAPGKAVDLPAPEAQMPEIVITAPRVRPGELGTRGIAEEARVSQDPSVKRRGG
jgi:hypothetical protein